MKKSLWKATRSPAHSFYCPLCKEKRSIPIRVRPVGPQQLMQLALSAAFVAVVTWPWFHGRAAIVFFPFWAAFEWIHRTRVRASLSCPHCGFDPYLFMSNAKLARTEVENYWKARFAEKGLPWPEKGKPGILPMAPGAKPGAVPTTGKGSELPQ